MVEIVGYKLLIVFRSGVSFASYGSFTPKIILPSTVRSDCLKTVGSNGCGTQFSHSDRMVGNHNGNLSKTLYLHVISLAIMPAQYMYDKIYEHVLLTLTIHSFFKDTNITCMTNIEYTLTSNAIRCHDKPCGTQTSESLRLIPGEVRLQVNAGLRAPSIIRSTLVYV